MKYLLVLVAATEGALAETHFVMAEPYLQVSSKVVWLKAGKAAEILLENLPPRPLWDSYRRLLVQDRIDAFIVSAENRKKKLFVSDMDNTMIMGETLDDLAAKCGLKEEIPAITARTMEGELDFQEAYKTRIGMLKGLKNDALGMTADQIRYMPGAETCVQVMRAAGVQCILLSGGFSFFTSVVAKKLGFHKHHGNTLLMEDGVVTGEVEDIIIDQFVKRSLLCKYIAESGLTRDDVLAVGDGANDYPMLAEAGLGVGFYPKKYLWERVDNAVLYGDLTALLHIQGYNAF